LFICLWICLFFSLIYILCLNLDILPSACSILLECLSVRFLFDLRSLLFQGFLFFFSCETFHIFVKLLFPILCCLLYLLFKI
jgi:hypothetical protein